MFVYKLEDFKREVYVPNITPVIGHRFKLNHDIVLLDLMNIQSDRMKNISVAKSGGRKRRFVVMTSKLGELTYHWLCRDLCCDFAELPCIYPSPNRHCRYSCEDWL